MQNLAETSRSYANRKSLTAEKSLSTWRSYTRWKANAILLFIEEDNKRMSISLFNARDNFALDKIKAKSSQDHAADVIEEEGKMIPRYHRHKTFKVQICMLQPVPHLSWSCLLDVESRDRPYALATVTAKSESFSFIPAILNVRFFLSFPPSRSSFAHMCNFTPSEAKDFTSQPRDLAQVSRAVTASLCENSLWSFRGFRA